jgi:probable HAF family extracellular repeat protein
MIRKTALQILFVVLPHTAIAESYQFFGLGMPQGAVGNTAANVSADGRVVVGQVEFGTTAEAYYWTNQTGFVLLGDLPGGGVVSSATDVSGDGSVIVGRGLSGPFFGSPTSGIEGFWWSQLTGMLPMGDLPSGSFDSTAHTVSTDGQVAFGRSATSNGYRAFRWLPSGGMQNLGNVSGLNGQQSEAFGASDDGQVVAGRVTDGPANQAVRWTPTLGMHLLVNPAQTDTYTEASAVSGDGNVVVGRITDFFQGSEAFRWTEQTGLVRLGKQPVGDTLPENTNHDGTIIVGAVFGVPGFSSAFIWDEVHGQRDLREVLINDYGLASAVQGWTLREANGISADGRVIAGWGINPAGQRESWVVRIVPEPTAAVLVAAAIALLPFCSRRSGRVHLSA